MVAGQSRQRRPQIKQIAGGRYHATAADQALDVTGTPEGNEQRHRTTSRGDLQGAPRLDAAEILACSLPQLPYPNGFHGATL
jgi:hypothetical protein